MPVITSGLMRIGRDAETRFLPSGQPVVTVSLAYNYGKRNDQGQRASCWIEAGFWGDFAAKMAPDMLKGMLIHAVLEDVHLEEFKKRDGSPGFKLAARMQSFDFTAARGHSDDQQRAPAPAPQQATPAQRSAAARPAPPPAASSGFDDMDDDIPF